MTIYSGVISCREEDPCDQLKGALNWLTAPLVLLVMKKIQGMNSHFWDGLFQGLCSVLLVGILHDLIQTWKNYLNKFFEKWKAQPDDTNHPSSICGSSVATLRFASIHEIQQATPIVFWVSQPQNKTSEISGWCGAHHPHLVEAPKRCRHFKRGTAFGHPLLDAGPPRFHHGLCHCPWWSFWWAWRAWNWTFGSQNFWIEFFLSSKFPWNLRIRMGMVYIYIYIYIYICLEINEM